MSIALSVYLLSFNIMKVALNGGNIKFSYGQLNLTLHKFWGNKSDAKSLFGAEVLMENRLRIYI